MKNPPINESASRPHARVAYLDGMRFFAIMAVICFHYFTGWAEPKLGVYPYGDVLAAPFTYGYLGVEFFFMISGVVIMMTLVRCGSWGEFMVRRAARIVPAMLLFSLVTFSVVAWLRPNIFEVSAWGFVPSWLFIRPEVLNRVLETTIFNSIDSVYWSLYVEVKFYLVIGTLYFLWRNGDFYRNALAFFIFCFVIGNVLFLMEWHGWDLIGFTVISTRFPWFLIGIGFYLYLQGSARLYPALYVATGMAQLWIVAALDPSTVRFVIPVLLPLMFFAILRMELLQKILSWKPIAMIGVASYGLYLVHQNVGILFIEHIARALGLSGWSAVPVAVAVTAGLAGGCILVFRYVEYPLNRWIVGRLSKVSAA